MHGGAKGSGAPPGERNGAYRHGRFTGRPVIDGKVVFRTVVHCLGRKGTKGKAGTRWKVHRSTVVVKRG
jgi:hypothetical protein